MSEFANEEGLDLVCWDPYSDGWGGRPIYLFQCASGEDWKKKTHTPDINMWSRVIGFSNFPSKAFAIPFALLEKEFRKKSGTVNGILLDRFRLHACCEPDEEEWASDDLRSGLLSWLQPRVKQLPLADV